MHFPQLNWPLLAALTLTLALPGIAQTPAEPPTEPPAPEVAPAPAAPAPQPALSDAERIALCKKKRDKPLDPQDSPPMKVAGGVTRPTIIHRADPQFSRDGTHGSIFLEGIIDEDGCLRELKVTESLNKNQDAAALKAVRQWVFRPALFEGKPVRVYYGVTMNYH